MVKEQEQQNNKQYSNYLKLLQSVDRISNTFVV